MSITEAQSKRKNRTLCRARKRAFGSSIETSYNVIRYAPHICHALLVALCLKGKSLEKTR